MPGPLPLFALALLLHVPDGPRMARVVAEQLDVFDRPSDAAIVTGGLVRGAQVVVQGDEDDGWLAISPPPGSQSWIDGAAIQVEWTDRARVILPLGFVLIAVAAFLHGSLVVGESANSLVAAIRFAGIALVALSTIRWDT